MRVNNIEVRSCQTANRINKKKLRMDDKHVFNNDSHGDWYLHLNN